MRLPALRRRRLAPKGRQIARRYRRYHKAQRRYKVLIETDKPLYKPGESIWVRAVEVDIRGDRLPQVEQRAYIRLLNARKQVVAKKLVRVKRGHSAAAFVTKAGQDGGVYTIQYANVMNGALGHHRVQLRSYMAQRIRKTLRFLRRGLGPGDLVLASLKLPKPKGASSLRTFTVSLRLGGKRVRQWQQSTTKDATTISFRLPKKLPPGTDGRADGQLVIKLRQAGLTETLIRDLPLAHKDVDVGFFPEGGKAIVGLPSRIYMAAKDRRARTPVDIEGIVKDDAGRTVATVKTYHRGMGRFVYTPQPGRRYTFHVTRPIHVKRSYPLPQARRHGVAMQLLDALHARQKALTLRLQSKKARQIFGLVTQGQQIIGQGRWQLTPGIHKLVVPLTQQRRGIARITLFGASGEPLAERLTFRHITRALRLSIKLKAPTGRDGLRPRQTVAFAITARDATGRPVAGAHLGVAVVDDALLRQADDHAPGWLAQRYLRSREITGKIFRPNFYFSQAPKAVRALDLVMGTHGWRRFRSTIERWHRLRRPPKASKPFDAVKRYQAWKAEQQRTKRIPRRLIPRPTANDWKKWFPLPRRIHKTVGAIKQHLQHLRKKIPPGGDQDGDGIPDAQDKCPTLPGPRSRQGCPTRQMIKVYRSRIEIRSRVYFDAGSDRIKPKAYPLLDAVAKVLQNHPQIQLRVEGNTDSTERPKGALKLSRQRALQVRRYLIKQGIDPLRLLVKGYGAKRPLAPNRLRSYRAKNRNVGFWIVSQRWRRPTGPWWFHVAASRVFPTTFYKGPRARNTPRDDRSTVFWAPHLKTDQKGCATVSFGVGDRITAYRLKVSGVGGGLLGTARHVFATRQPLYLQVRWPKALSYGDGLALPVTAHNMGPKSRQVTLLVKTSKHLSLEGDAPKTLSLQPGQRVTWFVPLRVVARQGQGQIDLSLQTAQGQRRDHHSRKIAIETIDFPHRYHAAGILGTGGRKSYQMTFTLPKDQRGTTLKGAFRVYPSLLSRLQASAATMLREPHGCFEQTSAANFPNTMLLQLLKASRDAPPWLIKLAYGMVHRGAAKLRRFRTPSGGYSLYGRGHGSLWLTAYGIWQFAEIKRVAPFPSSVIQDAIQWLHKQRKANGGYTSRSYWKGISSSLAIEAYIAFALAESGVKQLDWELRHLLPQLARRNDAYILALALNAMIHAWGKGDKRVRRWTKKLRSMQQKSGSFTSTGRAVVGSYGHDLNVQTTALALLALSRAGVAWDSLMGGVFWLQQQSRWGSFGSTQATILALKTLVTYQHSRPAPAYTNDHVVVMVNGTKAETAAILRDGWKAITLSKWRKKLRAGRNVVQLKVMGPRELPYSLGLSYMSSQPMTHAKAPLALKLSLSTSRARQGQVVRLHTTVTNKTNKAQWFPLIQLQLPAGLRASQHQLKAMQQRGAIDLFETDKRAIYLYLRKLGPHQTQRLDIDCVAEVTGHFIGNTSHAYPYYNPRYHAWAAPLRIVIGK